MRNIQSSWSICGLVLSHGTNVCHKSTFIRCNVFILTFTSALLCCRSTRLAGTFMSLQRGAGAASPAMCWKLAHFVFQALQTVQPAKGDGEWRRSFLLLVRLPPWHGLVLGTRTELWLYVGVCEEKRRLGLDGRMLIL